MEINIRLYRAHDEDLFAIYQQIGGRQIGIYIKDTLTALVRHEMPRLKFPEVDNSTFTSDKRSVRLHLSINEKMFKEETEVLNKIAPAYRQVFIKSLLRVYHFNELLTLYGVSGLSVDTGNINMNNVNVLTTLLNAISTAQPVQTGGTKEPGKDPDVSEPENKTKKKQKVKEDVKETAKDEELIKKQSEADMDALADMFGL